MSSFQSFFVRSFPFDPTVDQQRALEGLAVFLTDRSPFKLFVLSGYAGTGKTTLVAHLVQSLKAHNHRCELLAPTGRAAKVFSQMAGERAFTIHKRIYRKTKVQDGSIQLALAPNLCKETVFIVDEASMIGDYTMQSGGNVSERNLLDDVLNFVFGGKDCSLIFVGDVGQLPPVGSDFSPALNKRYLQENYRRLKMSGEHLSEVMRQSTESTILKNATEIRKVMPELSGIALKPGPDVHFINGLEFQEILESSYSSVGKEECMIVTRSNKRSNAYNQEIRRRILFHEEELTSGDVLMAVRNNYFWLDESSEAGFIANGELLVVERLLKQESFYGFRFQRIRASMIDYPDLGSFELILLLDSLDTEGPSLPRERMRELFFEVEKDYADERNKKKRYEKILANPYFNALQVKFAYAVTCHKSQGGQWRHLFLDHGYLPDDWNSLSFYRWLYTAITRATEKLYIVNPDERLIHPDFQKNLD
ncbi:MAG: DUF2075 domain-containing protein [Bacteroidetes bacterium]|nr:MAG: DUF2075 domain-containing protein [Bacteroidota bacterium]